MNECPNALIARAQDLRTRLCNLLAFKNDLTPERKAAIDLALPIIDTFIEKYRSYKIAILLDSSMPTPDLTTLQNQLANLGLANAPQELEC